MDEDISESGINVDYDDLGIPPEQQPEKTVDCTIPKADRAAIKELKPTYIRQVSKAARKQIFRGQVLPVIFDHWAKIGDRPKNAEEAARRIKVHTSIFYDIFRNGYILIHTDTCAVVVEQLATDCHSRSFSERWLQSHGGPNYIPRT